MTRGQDHSGAISNYCVIPEKTVSVDMDSNCFLCNCTGWLPVPVGKVSEFNSYDEIFTNPTASMLRQDIAEKKYTWCAVEYCGVSHHNIDSPVFSLNIGVDNSCNLSCPSCRRDPIMINAGPVYEQRLNDVRRMISWLDKITDPIVVSFGGTGDPLASAIMRPLILEYTPKKNQYFIIGTNGLLIKKIMSKSKLHGSVHSYKISVDAGSSDIYRQVRRPGRWNDLLENLQWLKDNRQPNQLIELSFLVQRTNYRDIPRFVDLCEQFGFNGSLDPLVDWGTWNPVPVETPDAYTLANGTFLDHDVANPTHSEHKEFVNEIHNFLLLKQNCVTMKPYFNKFLT